MQFSQDLITATCCISYGLSVTQMFVSVFFATLKAEKDIQPLYIAVVCPYFMIDRVSNICTTQSAYFPLGGLL